MKAPFPYFGGKAFIAPLIWQLLGDVKSYIEPFAGGAAVLLARPNYRQGEHVETLNDLDAILANVWRALRFAPDEVARSEERRLAEEVGISKRKLQRMKAGAGFSALSRAAWERWKVENEAIWVKATAEAETEVFPGGGL